jgi:hypothetical protein
VIHGSQKISVVFANQPMLVLAKNEDAIMGESVQLCSKRGDLVGVLLRFNSGESVRRCGLCRVHGFTFGYRVATSALF